MKDKVYVWDPLVRLSHWTLVLGFIIAYLSGDEDNALHIYSGYYILGVVAVRLIWGLVGTRHARFGDFIYSPTAVLDYLKGFVGLGSGKQYLGHNPAGGWMVIALLLSLVATGISGLKLYGLEGHGPLAENTAPLYQHPAGGFVKVSSYEQHEREDHDDDEHEAHEDDEHEDEDERDEDEAEEEFWEEIHEFFANFTVLLVLLHIAGVIASSIHQRQNLVASMWTGFKRGG